MNQTEIVKILDKHIKNNRMILYKGEEERKYLYDYINAIRKKKPEITEDVFEIIKNTIGQCSLCKDMAEKKYGFGGAENGIIVLLNTPKLVNNLERNIYKKDSVDLLKKMLYAISVKLGECYLTNLIKCEIDNTLLKPSQIIKNCESILRKEIELLNPHTVIVLGEMISLQKIIKESSGITWFNVEHPITLIKNPELKRSAWSTLKLVADHLKASQ